jgi:hypothetical protein
MLVLEADPLALTYPSRTVARLTGLSPELPAGAAAAGSS